MSRAAVLAEALAHMPPELRAWVLAHPAEAERALEAVVTVGEPWTGPPAPRELRPAPADAKPDTTAILPLHEYDLVVVGLSGGKDSIATALHVQEQIADLPAQRRPALELWHHAVDGRPGAAERVFDWPCTEAYCGAVAKAMGAPLYFSWREGGILREMQREGEWTQGVTFEGPDGERHVPTRKGKLVTRRQLDADGTATGSPAWPQMSGNLNVRWCSAYAKIMVCRTAIANDPRLRSARVLLLTGERREESPGRRRYATAERHPATTGKRRVDQWRPLLGWTDAEVWGIIQRYGIVPHPCYWLGFGRASCETCIFSKGHEWATIRELHPARFARIAELERWARKTIHRKRSVVAQAAGASALTPESALRALWAARALGETWSTPIVVPPEAWVLPAGAFRKGAGPT